MLHIAVATLGTRLGSLSSLRARGFKPRHSLACLVRAGGKNLDATTAEPADFRHRLQLFEDSHMYMYMYMYMLYMYMYM